MARIRPVRALRFRDEPRPWPRTDGDHPLDPDHPATPLAQPEGGENDRSKFVRYAHSAARLAQLRKSGDLVTDAEPTTPTLHGGTLALVHQDDLLVRDDLPPAAIEARKRLLEATRTFFEIPVGYEEGDRVRIALGEADVLAAKALARRPPAWIPVLILPQDAPAPIVSVGVFVHEGDNA